MVVITKHAYKRAKERMGLGKKAIERIANKAYNSGILHKDTVGRLHRYLDGVYLTEHKATDMRIYGEFLYIFKSNILLTVLTLDNNLKKLL